MTEGGGLRAWLRARRDPVLASIVHRAVRGGHALDPPCRRIKGASDATRWLTSTALTEWNFGTIDQRLLWGNWTIMDRMATGLTGYPAWLLPLAALLGLRTRIAGFWAALVAVPIINILVFWNLYVVHDYYLVAASPVLAAVTGFGFARAWHAIDQARPRGLLVALLGTWMVALVVLLPIVSTLPYKRFSVDKDHPDAREAARLTLSTDLVAFDGYGWDPTVPYHSRRAGRMIRSEPAERLTANQLARAGYRLLVTPHLDVAPCSDRPFRRPG